jgi:hypothetical protein
MRPLKGGKMKRHSYALDLLRKGITTEDEYSLMTIRQEYTVDDIQQILDSALKVAEAARLVLKDKLPN